MKRIIFAIMILPTFFLCINTARAYSFTDVWPGTYYFDAVNWAVENNITNGTGDNTFSPNYVCSQGQFFLMLWRFNGAPEPAGGNSFGGQVAEIFYKPALWAYENGLINSNIFDAGANCRLEILLHSLWLLAGRPNGDAYSWAVESGLSKDTGINSFSSDYYCSRGQVVTFLYRYNILQNGNSDSDNTIHDRRNSYNDWHDDRRSRYDDYDDDDYDDDDYNDDDYDDDYNDYDNDNNNDELTISISQSKSSSILGSMYTIDFQVAARASGGSGDYQYKFELIQNGEITDAGDWSENNAVRSRVSGNGSCELKIYVKDSEGAITSQLIDLLQSSSFSHYPGNSSSSSISGSSSGIVISSGWGPR